MANRSVKVTLSANVADFKAQMRQASTSLDELVKKADKTGEVAQTGLGRMAQSMQQQRAQWDQTGAALTGFGVATTGALTASAKAAIDWESAFAGVKKTAGEGWNLDKLNQDLRALASELPASHAEIAAVAEAAGQLGIREENITSFTRAMINMGEATNMSADEAATTLARFANIMGTSQSEFENLGSAIVELGNNYATTEAEIANMAMRLASAGNQIGLTEGDVLGIATALSSVGIEAEAGGTAFSRVMLDMRKAVDTGSEKLETFAQVAGMSSQAFAQLFQENSGEALTRFIQGLGEMEKAGQSTQPILEQLGMTDIRVGNALRSSASAADLFAEAMQTGNSAYQEGTALSKEAAARYETLASQMGILRNKVVEAAIGFGEQLMPAIKLAVDVIGGVVDTIGALPGPVQAVLAGFTGLAGTVALAGGAFALLAPRALEAVTAFKALATTFPAVAAGASTLAGAVAKIALPAAAFAGFTALIDSASKIDPAPAEELASALSDIATRGETASSALETVFNSKYTLGPFRDEVKTTEDVLAQFEKTLNNAWGSSTWEKMDRFLGDWNAGDRAREQIAALDTTLAQMVASGNAEEAARLYEQLMHTASEMDLEIPADELEGQFGQYRSALESSAEAVGETADATSELEAAQAELAASTQAVAEAFNKQADSYDAVIDAQRNLRGEAATLAEAQKAWVKNYEDMLIMADKSGAVLNEAADGFNMWTDRGMAAHDVAEGLRDAMWEQAEAMYSVGKPMSEVNAKLTEMTADWEHVLGAMGLTSDQIEMIAEQYGLIPENITTVLDADSTKAQGVLDGYLVEIDMASGTVTIDGDTVPADGSLATLMGKVADSEGFITINGNRVPADSTVKDLVGWVLEQHPAVSVLADPTQAFSTTNSLIGRISGMKPVFQVDADTSRAWGSAVGMASQISNKTSASIKVSAHDTGVVSQARAMAASIGASVGASIAVKARMVPGFASGGYITGPGTGTSDSIPAWLSNGEYVIRAASVAKYGRAFFDKLNAGRYASGGYVSPRSYSPTVNVAPASLEGLRLAGSFRIGDAIVPLVDGRIVRADKIKKTVGRRP